LGAERPFNRASTDTDLVGDLAQQQAGGPQIADLLVTFRIPAVAARIYSPIPPDTAHIGRAGALRPFSGRHLVGTSLRGQDGVGRPDSLVGRHISEPSHGSSGTVIASCIPR